MKIAYVLVNGGRDYRAEACADESGRVDCLLKTVAAVKAGREEVALLVFPAGYFQRSAASDLPAFAESVAKRLAGMKPSFGVVWGMDASAKKLRSKAELPDEGRPSVLRRLPRPRPRRVRDASAGQRDRQGGQLRRGHRATGFARCATARHLDRAPHLRRVLEQ